MILFLSKDERELVEKLRKFDKTTDLSGEVLKLRREIADLQIQKSKITEDHERQDRELRHMIGLEKKRQEVEIEQAKRETTLQVREQNLAAERAQFEKNLAFNTERFTSMEKYLKDMMGEVLQRLPNVNVKLSSLSNG